MIKLTGNIDLPMWTSGPSTRAPCAAERGVLSSWGSNLSSGASAYQRIISTNFYAHDEQEDNPGQEKEGLMVSFINCYHYRHLDLAVSSLSAVPT